MATAIGSSVATLVDVAKRTDPDGSISAVAELLALLSPVAADVMTMEANQATSHRMTARTSLPAPGFRSFNEGVAVDKSTTSQYEEALAMLETYSEVDVDLAALNGNTMEFRLSESVAFIEGMVQKYEATFFGPASSLESGLDVKGFRGLSVRYNSLSGANAEQIVNGGGSGADNASIWIVGHGAQGLFGLYPKGSKAGLVHEDKGQKTIETASGIGGSRMEVYQDRYQWKCGIGIKDPRKVVRICNIDRSLLSGGTAADLPELLIKGLHKFRGESDTKPVIYCDRVVNMYLDLQCRADVLSGGGLKYENVDGKVIGSFRGVPIHVSDALRSNEATIS